MRSKIFNTTLYTIIMVLGLYTIAFSQDTPPDKKLEEKMAKMEQKLKEMQSKLDSMQAKTDRSIHAIRIDGQTYNIPNIKALTDSDVREIRINGQPGFETLKSIKIAPRPATRPTQLHILKTPSPAATVQGFSYSNDVNGLKSIQITPKASTHSYSYSSMDKSLEEKIKSGEIKEKTKSFTKSYSVSSGDKLQINNSYGKVTINTWNKKEFKVEVDIRGIANEYDDAQKLLDGITITDNKDNGVISFNTRIESQNHQWGTWSNNGKSYVNKAIVNYTVYMPSKSALEIRNRFGAVTLPDFGGKLLINTQYGTFTAKELTNTENDITTRFSDVNIASISGSTLKCEYSNGGGVKIGSANNLKFTAGFVGADIARIKNSGEISVRYGDGLKIADLDKNVKILNVNSSFAPITLGSKSNYDFSVSIRMGGDLKYDDDRIKVTTKTPEDSRRFSTTKTYTGYAGKSNSDTKVTITNSYQGVQIQ